MSKSKLIYIERDRIVAALSYEVREHLGGRDVEDLDPAELKFELLKVRSLPVLLPAISTKAYCELSFIRSKAFNRIGSVL